MKGTVQNEFPPWLNVLSAIALANFAVFLCAAAYFGGNALNGYVANNHYFLDWKGTYTEVSKAVFVYSKIHTLSVFGTTAVAVGGWLWVVVKRSADRKT